MRHGAGGQGVSGRVRPALVEGVRGDDGATDRRPWPPSGLGRQMRQGAVEASRLE